VGKNRYGVTYTSADEYRDQGVLLWEADNDRINGKKKIDQVLSLLPDGKPGLVIFRNCVNLIRTIPKLARSSSNPEDVADRQEDHAYDTLRYGLTNPLMFTKRDKNKKKGSSKNPWVNITGI
jgi:phage terminase large subunit